MDGAIQPDLFKDCELTKIHRNVYILYEVNYFMNGKSGQADAKLLLAIAVMMLGGIGSIFWALGIAMESGALLWLGRLLIASIPFMIALLDRFLK